MRVLLVDDDSTRYDQFKMNNPSIHFTFVTTSSDAIKIFDANNYDVICLDHDLGDSAMIKYYTNVINLNNKIISFSNIIFVIYYNF